MKKMLRVELHDGEILEGIIVDMTGEFLRNFGLPQSAQSMFPGIWLHHSNFTKVSFLANDLIKSKKIIR